MLNKDFPNKYTNQIFVYIIKIIKRKIMQLIEKLRIVLGLVEAEIKLSESLLEDGVTMVQAEEFAIGYPLNVIGADGAYTPAPQGEHMLADGTKLVVDANGVITEVVAPVEEAPAEEVEAAAEELAAPSVSVEDFNALVDKIAKLEEAIMMSAQTFKDENKNLNEKVEKLSAAPAGEPIKSKGVIPQEENALRGLLKK